jgi:lipopolysaccharide/colanic/teichoic acid biosynthesis glycosyltransferase
LTNARPAPPLGRAVIARPQRSRRFAGYDRRSATVQSLIAALALIVLAPVFAVIAVLIKLSSPGPVLYRAERVGRGFRRFKIYKFRTMLEGTEALVGPRLLTPDEKARYCTRIGRVLKRTKLDELPQLINVVKGDMRLVGPRPVRPIFLERFLKDVPGYAARFGVPPGITGIAQLRGGYYTPPRNKLRYDLVYIRSRSMLLDLRLTVMTFVKILDRWLSMGVFVLFVFFLASFVPATARPFVRVPGVGVGFDLISLLLITLSVWAFVKVQPARFSLYRCPINLSIVLFVAVSIVSTALARDPALALRGSAYYVVTGFLTAFVIVNTLATTVFITWTVRVIALTSAVISLLGFFESFATNVAVGAAATGKAVSLATASSILGSPVELAVYLVLGMPLLLAEVTCARSVRERDFWLVCATLSFVGVFLTQTRVGLLALLVTGVVFLYRRRAEVLTFAGVFVLCILLLVSLGLPRFSVPDVADDISRRLQDNAALVRRPAVQWLVGAGAAGTADVIAERQFRPASPAGPPRPPAMSNMHLTLLAEHGVLGWAIVMWIVLATIVAIKHAHDRTRDERLKTLLWAILSSLAGYLVSMASMNTFHHLPIQIFFWSLVGIGLGLATRVGSVRSRNVIWRFGDAGD